MACEIHNFRHSAAMKLNKVANSSYIHYTVELALSYATLAMTNQLTSRHGDIRIQGLMLAHLLLILDKMVLDVLRMSIRGISKLMACTTQTTISRRAKFSHPKWFNSRYWYRIRRQKAQRHKGLATLRLMLNIHKSLVYVIAIRYKLEKIISSIRIFLYCGPTPAGSNMHSKRAHNNKEHYPQQRHSVSHNAGPHPTGCRATGKPRAEEGSAEHTCAKAAQQLDEQMMWGGARQNKKRGACQTAASNNNLYMPFTSEGTSWLSAHQIQQCLRVLLHMQYTECNHQNLNGITHMVAPEAQFLHKMRQAGNGQMLEASNEAEQLLREAFERGGPSPAFVLGIGLHFKNVLFNARLKQVSLIDPLGHDFPRSVQDAIMRLGEQDKMGQWKYTQWNVKLQHDNGNCGIWAIWIHEKWMQYWQQDDVSESFEEWFQRNNQVVPEASGLRKHYHHLMQAAATTGADGRTGLEKSLEIAAQRMSIQRDLVALHNDSLELLQVNIPGSQHSMMGTFKMHNNTHANNNSRGKMPDTSTRSAQSKLRETHIKTEPGNKGNETDEDDWVTVTYGRRGGRKQQVSNSTKARTQGEVKPMTRVRTTQAKKILTKHSHRQVTSTIPCIPENALQNDEQSRKRTDREATHDETHERTLLPCVKQQKGQPPAEHTARCNTITVLTHNIMGTTTMVQEAAMTAADKAVDIRVFTETKLTEGSPYQRELEVCMPEYKFYHSCKTIKDNAGKKHKRQENRDGAAGVTIAVHSDLLTQNTVSPIRIDDPIAKGRCKAISITPPGSEKLIMWGVYGSHDQIERDALYKVLRREVPRAEEQVMADTGRKCFTILAGDWNAALLPGDRPMLTSRDTAHQQLMETLEMVPTETRGPSKRAASHHPQAEGLQGSRIDDILASRRLIQDQSCHSEVICGTGDSDHSALLSSIPLTHMLLLKPGPGMKPLPRPRKLKTPVAQQQLAAFKEAFANETDAQVHALNTDLDCILQEIEVQQRHETANSTVRSLLANKGINDCTVEDLGAKLQQILSQAVPVAQTTCDYTQESQMDHKRFPQRTIGRKKIAIAAYRTALNNALQQYDNVKHEDVQMWQKQLRTDILQSNTALPTIYQGQFPLCPATGMHGYAGIKNVSNNS